MRIISGKFRKKSIFPPKNFKARPTTDMAKESLFNILENLFDISSLKVLDLFGGTGSISYEFASRECNDITCVELNYPHYTFIKKTIKELKIENQIKIKRADVFRFLKKQTVSFDLIFADPPYQLRGIEVLPDLVFSNNLLNTNGLLIIEHSADTTFNNNPHFYLHKKYGSVNFSFFKKNE